MQMVTGCDAGCASQPDLLSGTHNCTAADAEATQVHVDRFVAVLMVNNNIVSGGGAISGRRNSGTGGVDRPAGSGIQISDAVAAETLMVDIKIKDIPNKREIS